MDKARDWLQNPKNMPIVLAGTVVILLLVALMILKTNGTIGGGEQYAPPPSIKAGGSSAAPGSAPGKTTTPTPSAPATPTPSASVPATPAPSTSTPAAPAPSVGSTAAPTTVASSSAGAPIVDTMGPMLPYRKDPFSPLGVAPSAISKLVAELPSVQLPRFARIGPITRKIYVKQTPVMEEPLPTQPLRRMAGVLMSGRLSAIMETNGESDIVKPGMTISKGGSTVLVESIEPSAIILKTLDTRTPHRIRVNLTGAIEAAPTAPSPDSTGSVTGSRSRRGRPSPPPPGSMDQ